MTSSMSTGQLDDLAMLADILRNRVNERDPLTLAEQAQLVESLAAILQGAGGCRPFVAPLRRRLSFKVIKGKSPP